jgi:hypothetical protein
MRNNDILEALRNISQYFATCWQNAAKGSAAERKFEHWIDAVDEAATDLRDYYAGEDDGK